MGSKKKQNCLPIKLQCMHTGMENVPGSLHTLFPDEKIKKDEYMVEMSGKVMEHILANMV